MPGIGVGVVDQHLALEAVGVTEEHGVRLAEVGDEVVGCTPLHQATPDLLERRHVLRPQADVVDPATAEHRHLAGGLGVALDVEDVEHGAVADVDDRHAEAFSLGRPRIVDDDPRLEDLFVEGVQAVGVVRERGHVVDAAEQHEAERRTRSLSRVACAACGYSRPRQPLAARNLNDEDSQMLLFIIAAVIAIVGVVQLIQGQILFGLILLVIACLVGPGGYSIFRSRHTV